MADSESMDRQTGSAGQACAPFVDPPPFAASAAGNGLAFYPDGKARLEALFGLIEGASHSLRLFFYIFYDEPVGRRVRDALAAAARRGVAVEVLVDSFGSDPDPAFFQPIVDAGGRFSVFMARWGTRYLIRNHQKMLIADGTSAILGGFNIADNYFAPPEEDGWNDLAVRVEGPAVAQLAKWFDQMTAWQADPSENFRAIRQLVREWDPGHGPVQVLLGGPTRVASSWARKVREDIALASRLDLVMAYFSPHVGFRHLIERVAQRGEARLVLAGKSDNTTTIAASRSLYRPLLQSGVAIYEFQPCKMHTKLIVVDDVVYVGSANFDMRSLQLNLEVMLRIEDAALAETMRNFVDGYVPYSRMVTPAEHRKQAGWWNRLRWWIGWVVVSVVDFTVARQLNLRA